MSDPAPSARVESRIPVLLDEHHDTIHLSLWGDGDTLTLSGPIPDTEVSLTALRRALDDMAPSGDQS